MDVEEVKVSYVWLEQWHGGIRVPNSANVPFTDISFRCAGIWYGARVHGHLPQYAVDRHVAASISGLIQNFE